MATRKVFSYLLISTGGLILYLVFVFMIATQVRTNQAPDPIVLGKQIFRYDTFGAEDFWGKTLKLHQVIEGTQFGGVEPGVSRVTARLVGLKVDGQALLDPLHNKITKGQVDLNDPAVNLAMLKLNSVVRLTGFFNADGSLRSIGIQCVLCHSTVDDVYTPGIGKELDGWAN